MRRMIAASVARRIALKKMGAGALALAAPMQVLAAVSDAGTPVVKARRIVSVGGALTEIVYALEAQGELVGVDTTSLYPVVAQQLPQVGYARTLSAEGVLSLAPTQLIATEEAGPQAVLRQVRDAGVPEGARTVECACGSGGITLPLRRMGHPQEVATAVVWLMSDEAAFVVGHCLATDGGFLAGRACPGQVRCAK